MDLLVHLAADSRHKADFYRSLLNLIGGYNGFEAARRASYQRIVFARCINVEEVEVAIVPGISRHKKSWQDVKDACRMLGYEPQDGTAFPRALC